MGLLFALANALPLPVLAQGAAKTVVNSERVRAELMVNAPQGVQAGQPLWVGLQLVHQPEWHTYWKNSGDSGLPTHLQWQLPAGITAGEIAWPLPKKIPIGNLANYGYEGTVLLPVPLTVGPDFKPGLLGNDLEIKLRAAWLVCRKECVPEDGEFALRIPLRSSTALHAADFDAAQKAQPEPLASTGSTVQVQDGQLHFHVVGLPAAIQGRTLALYPETPEVIETAAALQQSWQGAVWTATLPLAAQRLNSPDLMPLVVALDGGSSRQAWRVEAPVQGRWPALAQPGSPAATPVIDMQAPATPPLGWLAALAGALLGGLILNLMPCVFPVLAIKVLGFAQHADDRRAHQISGLAYSAGVVLSFMALGGLMLALRAGGEALGWGFQLQSPGVVAALAALFTVIGLNLAGVFEFGQMLPSGLANLQARNPALNAFVSGVLAVAIASPCTAPFMGASLGLAVGLPAAQALLVFATVGVGMALPYLAASWLPALARTLPRPGAWMETLRHFMAFPMFATVAWLVWVLGQQSGIDGAGALLALLVALSALAWGLALRGRARLPLAAGLSVLLALLVWTLGPHLTRTADAGPSASVTEQRWRSWEPGRVEQELASGQPVFVDFTAAWCVTCQYNKKTTLANAGLLAEMDTHHIHFLRADWTRRDPAITAALGQLGRNGVPVYVLYRPGKTPLVLSEVLSVDELRTALQSL